MVYISTVQATFLILAAASSLAAPIATDSSIQSRGVTLEARTPNFGSFFRKVRKAATPSRIKKIAHIAELALRENEDEQIVTRRELEYLEDLVLREPSIGSFFRKVKNFFTPHNIDKASNAAKEASKLAGMLKREASEDLSARSLEAFVDQLTEREFEDIQELAAREPRFGSFFKKFINMKNIKKAASVASLVIREDDEPFYMFEREALEADVDNLD
ncbi:hypothetical protein JR316_0009167 [Psilocybe cubensis]|uniref:Uncharacterized protein n=2 Tax=Psilocybe cubensis TaxID=181762 RepID=A0A8H8CJ35_PSICU|nr:hypothetical protein JR316_0009167 [Psilocybe cubensis]KAH9478707.1 hypothetical protein JR316_0009167 [Psilocybe cubensis]